MQKKRGLSAYEQEMNRELESRISQLEQEDYDYGKPFNKWDWLFVGFFVVAGIAITVSGIF